VLQSADQRISAWKLCIVHTTSAELKQSFLKDLLDFETPCTQESTLPWDSSASGLSPSLNSPAVTAEDFSYRIESHQKPSQAGACEPRPSHSSYKSKNS